MINVYKRFIRREFRRKKSFSRIYFLNELSLKEL